MKPHWLVIFFHLAILLLIGGMWYDPLTKLRLYGCQPIQENFINAAGYDELDVARYRERREAYLIDFAIWLLKRETANLEIFGHHVSSDNIRPVPDMGVVEDQVVFYHTQPLRGIYIAVLFILPEQDGRCPNGAVYTGVYQAKANNGRRNE